LLRCGTSSREQTRNTLASEFLIVPSVPFSRIEPVKDVLGQTKISQTMDTYAHVLPETKREAINLMGTILNKTKVKA
jgi:hypothetical protein